MVGKQIDDVSVEQSIIFRARRWLEKSRRGFNRTVHYFQGWRMVGKQVDEVSIEQSIIFRAGGWLENK